MKEKRKNLGIIITNKGYRDAISNSGSSIDMQKLLDADVNRTYQESTSPSDRINKISCPILYGWTTSFGSECVSLIRKIALKRLEEEYDLEDEIKVLNFTFTLIRGHKFFVISANIKPRDRSWIEVSVCICMDDGKIQIVEGDSCDQSEIDKDLVNQIWFDLRESSVHECQPIMYNLRMDIGMWTVEKFNLNENSFYDLIYNNYTNPIENPPKCNKALRDYFSMQADHAHRQLVINIGESKYFINPDPKLAFAHGKICSWLSQEGNHKWIVLGFRLVGFRNVCIVLRRNKDSNIKEGFILVIDDKSINQIVVLNEKRSIELLKYLSSVNNFMSEDKTVEVV